MDQVSNGVEVSLFLERRWKIAEHNHAILDAAAAVGPATSYNASREKLEEEKRMHNRYPAANDLFGHLGLLYLSCLADWVGCLPGLPDCLMCVVQSS